MGRMGYMGRGWDRGGMEGPTLASSGTGAPPSDLEGGGRWETVADTNCVGDARAQSICVREAKQYK